MKGVIASVVTMWVKTIIAVSCLGLLVTAQSRYSSDERSYRRNYQSRPSQWRDLADEYDRDEDRGPQTPSIKYPLQAIPYELPIGVRGANLQLLVLPIPMTSLNPGPSQKSECKLTPEPEEPIIDVRSGAPTIYSSPPLGIPSSPRVPTRHNIPPKAVTRNEVQNKAPSYPSYLNVEKLDQPVIPPEIPPSESSKEILEQFLAQAPQAPQLPPVLLSEYDKNERIPHPEEEDEQTNLIEESSAAPTVKTNLPYTQNVYSRGRKVQTQPSRPRFSQSVVIRGELSVPKSDFTEPYTAWWDASSGSSKVDFHGGSTSTYRTVMADKRLQRLEMRVDRSGERAVRRCGKASSYQNNPLDISHPALPDIDLFNFVGYEPDGRVERWQHTVVGREGELGAIQGESLSLKHDLLLIRDSEDNATPILYTVSVNSSLLGPNADSYEHRYLDVRRHEQNADFFIPNISDLCDTVESLNASIPEHLSRLEPLREYIQPHRDQKYVAAIQNFKVKYNRRYIDNSEEAVRTALLMQHKRFISSGNREGATFELGVNFLGDRLDNELKQLRGVKLEEERTQAELFPHSRSMLRKESAKLPDNFDWRVKGGVSPVGFQGKCSSCWSFAVSGAVEGALFARTGKLVPLSQQCLVDCAHPFGGKGCKGTWPSHAYDYVKNRGLPALDEYPSYKAKVEQCAEKSVRPVTRISGHVNVTANSLSALKVAIRDHAPTVVIVDAKLKSFVFYKHGVFYDDRCGKTRPRLNHAVLAVGWGDQNEEHFILKNSWSEAWGERGFMRIHARSNTCGVLTRPSYPRLEDKCKVTPEPEEPLIDVRSGAPTIYSSPPLGIPSSARVPIRHNIPPKAVIRNEVQKKAPSYPSYLNVEKLDQPVIPPEIPLSESSKEILEQFLAQAPQAPQLPPVLLSEYDKNERIPHPEEEDEQTNLIEESSAVPTVKTNLPYTQNVYSRGRKVQTQPSRPRFSQSVVIRGELSVPKSDFTEPYTAWWDASSGSSKVDFHGGSTSTYRTVMADKRLQRLEMRVDRSGERAVRRCGKASSYQNNPLDISHPALPDIDLFNFVGYEPDGRVERWQHTVVGREGELGAIQRESLSLKHDLLLIRDSEDKATPILYTVSVNSSLLGPNADSYEHRYLDVRRHEQNADFFIPNISDLCDTVESLNASIPEHLSRLEPLREYIQPHRDQKYVAAIQNFKVKYNRRYIDNSEEAVRTALLMQHKRFISSGNREGATFELGVNFLGDRLDNELKQLRGVKLEEERTQAELFPHSRSMLRKESAKLPDNFDWRVKGGVSPVGFQGKCSSCWSFAVSGAVEGALFARTGKLVPLSQQCLVDCAHPFGGKGCKGTWPSHAYDYVKNRGLPALDEYPSYKAKVEQCAEKSVRPVTRISGHVNVTANSLSALKVAIRDHAPTVVIVDAKLKSFVFYKHGVFYDDRCGKTRPRLNHAVLAVGWGDQNEEHFILKNSWSEAWGERGFMRIHARSNTCGVLTRPSYPRLEDSDVLSLPVRPTDKNARI